MTDTAIGAAPLAGPRSTPPAGRTHRRRNLPARAILHLIVISISLIWVVPVIGLFIGSIRISRDIASSGWWNAFIDPLFTTFNFRQAFAVTGVGGNIATSLAIAVPSMAMTTALAAIAGFALTKMRFRGQVLVSLLLVGLMVIPPQVTLVPMLRLFTATGLSGTLPAVWIFQVGVHLPFAIFIVRGFIAAIPDELFESSAIDGASVLRTFRSIVLPLSIPILASLGIMSFLWAWNDLLVPLMFLGGSALDQPITVAIAGQVQSTGQGESLLLATTVLSTLVPLAILLGLQRFFVRGLMGGAVKG